MNVDWLIIDEIEPIPMFTAEQTNKISKVKREIQSRISSSMLYTQYGNYVPWEDVYLTGGAIASLLQGNEPNDWDFYFKTEKSMKLFVSRLDVIKSSVADVNEKYADFIGTEGKMITSNSITMSDKNSFITMLYGDEKFVKSQFDFLHCTPHYNIKEEILYISYNQYQACINKKLIVNNHEMVKQHRIIKFKERGYRSND